MSPSTLTHLESSETGGQLAADALQTVCPATQRPLLCRYDLERARRALGAAPWRERPPGLWRFPEILPPFDERGPVTLGEGATPLLPLPALGAHLGLRGLWVKEEGANPTGSFKARGMAVAVTRARLLGAQRLVVPTAGNAGGALAAYGARAGLPVAIALPADSPEANRLEVSVLAEEVIEVDGHIGTAAAALRERFAGRPGVFDLSTLKEPYRLEGKKTMGYELFTDFDGELPDVVLYPAGGGTGLIGMWKAWDEMEALGWIGARRPRLVVVQAAGCAPIVDAFLCGADQARPAADPRTIAAGLRVPAPIGDRLMLRALRATQGTAVAVSDGDLLSAIHLVARREGLLFCPEGAATYRALERLLDDGWVRPSDRVVLFNTGSGHKYPEALRAVR